MRFKLIILPRARADIDRNSDWWADHHSVEQATTWSNKIYDQLEVLTNFPESCSLSLENEDFPFDIRDKLVGLGSRPSYRAIFTIQNQTVYVLAVFRSAQDRLIPLNFQSHRKQPLR